MNQGALKQADIQKQLEARAAKLRSIEVSINALKKVGTAEAISQANELNQTISRFSWDKSILY
jgi:hypothetical protein